MPGPHGTPDRAQSFLLRLADLLDNLVSQELSCDTILSSMRLETLRLLPFLSEGDCNRVVDYIVERSGYDRTLNCRCKACSDDETSKVIPFPAAARRDGHES